MNKKDLVFIRNKIDEIDDKIIELLNERCDMVEAVATYKKHYNLAVENLERENQIIVELSQKERYNNMVKTIYPTIFKFSKDLEENLINKN